MLARDARTLEPSARLSHLCLRSAGEADYEQLNRLFLQLGDTGASRNRIVYVKLATPLYTDLGDKMSGADRIGRLHYLELTAPKPDSACPTGPQMLVCTLASLREGDVKKVDSPSRPGWTLRFQRQGAADLSGLR